ncbi:unnamed protein product [Acanthoscelides obtectus]|uniref:Uncharacterized protein n=1 Tax=Acanthoscelides obtectus TaxID=200917 RepID=A0A9P0PG95_ACAOB|nr:unnamed protein product [Acanthoscelides obtectus]CAK1638243.1 hypothetical protein AOBTE_LOCUS10478 [Acanthoscelides obtectus]
MNQEIYEELLFARTLITDTKDFESRFEDILTMVIPPWIINPYGDIEETTVIIQEELTELSTNEELKVQFENGYQQFWLQNNKPVTYPKLFCHNLEAGKLEAKQPFAKPLWDKMVIHIKEQHTTEVSPDKVDYIVRTTCALHNWLRRTSANTYIPPGTTDYEDIDTGNIIPGSWRKDVANNQVLQPGLRKAVARHDKSECSL